MANGATLADLRARALDYADMTSSSFPVTARVTDYINHAASRLRDMLIAADEDWFNKRATYTLVNGQEKYELPEDFYRLSAVYYVSADRRYAIQKWERKEIDGFRRGPLRAGTFEIEYVPQLQKMELETDEVDVVFPTGWEDYIALSAAIRLMEREESDTSGVRAERAELEQNMVLLAEPRDNHDQGAVQDIYSRFNPASSFFREERYLRYRLMDNNMYMIEFEHLGV